MRIDDINFFEIISDIDGVSNFGAEDGQQRRESTWMDKFIIDFKVI